MEIPEHGRVLIIDDDPGDGELAVRRLRSLDTTVGFHLGPEGATEVVVGGEVEVVVLDVTMPGQGGLEVLRQIEQRAPHVRVLLYSAMDPDELAHVAREHGVDFLNKSSARTEFVRKVRSLLDESSDASR